MPTTAREGGGDAPLSLNTIQMGLVERYGGRRARNVVAAAAMAQMAWPLGRKLYHQMRRQSDFTITVPGVDEVYPDLHEWVLERIPEGQRKAMIATTQGHGRGDVAYESSPAGASAAPRLRLRYDGSRVQQVEIDGHKVAVAVVRERENLIERANLPENWRQQTEQIVFTAKTGAGRDAVVEMINGLIAAKHARPGPPALWIPSRWGDGWQRRGDLPPRTLDSIVLKAGQLEDLVDDLGRFLDEEDYYGKTSQPWHRGYVFHGVPGTGKTSVARALANHFGLTTYYMPLSDIERDTNLMSLAASIGPESVLLLEDVDVASAATERTEGQKRASIAAMLNALDGVWTPHGLVTIMTTNNREKLDPALTRPGRMDRDMEFTVLDEDQARRLAAIFDVDFDARGSLGAELRECVGESPAALIERLRNAREKRPRLLAA